VDGIYHLIRNFKDKDVFHSESNVDPFRDMEVIS